jgi:hypothetical protein
MSVPVSTIFENPMNHGFITSDENILYSCRYVVWDKRFYLLDMSLCTKGRTCVSLSLDCRNVTFGAEKNVVFGALSMSLPRMDFATACSSLSTPHITCGCVFRSLKTKRARPLRPFSWKSDTLTPSTMLPRLCLPPPSNSTVILCLSLLTRSACAPNLASAHNSLPHTHMTCSVRRNGHGALSATVRLP